KPSSSTSAAAAPPPRAASAPSNPSSTAVPARGGLHCEGCDKFVMSGADLLYWRRKREQWMAVAERAPDDVTADYLHQVFEPTARAIDGLEKALARLRLLDEALALDLRRPQDYFGRISSTALPPAH